MGMGQAQIQHSVGMGDQRGPQQHGSPRFGSASTSWSGGQGHRKSSGTHGRPPMGDRGTSGEKLVTPSSKLKQVFFISLVNGDLMKKTGWVMIFRMLNARVLQLLSTHVFCKSSFVKLTSIVWCCLILGDLEPSFLLLNRFMWWSHQHPQGGTVTWGQPCSMVQK